MVRVNETISFSDKKDKKKHKNSNENRRNIFQIFKILYKHSFNFGFYKYGLYCDDLVKYILIVKLFQYPYIHNI